MESCQQILRKVLSERTTKNRAYSLRSFARDLGLSPASLSAILGGSRGISPQMAEKISFKLPLATAERERFVQLATSQFSRNRRERFLAQKYLKSKNALLSVKRLKVSEVLIRNWYHLAILEAISDLSFDPTIKNLMERLKLSHQQVECALEELISIQAVVIDEAGRYQDNLGNLQMEDTPDSQPLRRFHSQVLDLAQSALVEQGSQEIYSQSMVFSINEEHMPEIRESVQNFVKQIQEIVSKTEGKGKIKCLTVQCFKLEC